MKTALIVGGSRGIGRAITLRLARSGMDIWLTYHSNHDAAQSVKQEVESLDRTCRLFAFDVADEEQTRQALTEAADTSPPYAVIYNSGIARDNLLVWMKPDEWSDVIRTNLDGFYHVVHAVLFPMLREKRGHVVAISSVSGQVGQGGQANYAASKAGLIGAAKSLAREVGRKNVFVNVVSPGVIETDMTDHLPREQILPLIPLNKFGKPEHVAAIVDFLCSEDNGYIHGQVIGVNGGLA